MERRLAEAARLGFTCAVVPPGVKTVPIGLRAIAADNITAAMRVLTEISSSVKAGRAEEGPWP
jgi:DNA repair protein RadA/Sms